VAPDLCAAAPEFAATALRTVRTEFPYDLPGAVPGPDAVPAGEVRAVLDEHLTPAAIETSTRTTDRPGPAVAG
jgi:hypothetical protein